MKFRDYWDKVRITFTQLVRSIVIVGIFFIVMVINGGILGVLAWLFPNYRILQNKDICLLIAVAVSGISVICVVKLIDRKLGITKDEHTNLRTQIWAALVGIGFAIVCLVIFFLLMLLFGVVWDIFARFFPDCRIIQYGVQICGALACICLGCIIYLDTKKWRILERILQSAHLGERKEKIKRRPGTCSNSPNKDEKN